MYFNLFHRGWYYFNDNNINGGNMYQDSDFVYTNDVILCSMELEMFSLPENKQSFFKQDEFFGCYLVLIYEDNIWKCFIDRHNSSPSGIYHYFTKCRNDFKFYKFTQLEIGNFTQEQYLEAQKISLEKLIEFINH